MPFALVKVLLNISRRCARADHFLYEKLCIIGFEWKPNHIDQAKDISSMTSPPKSFRIYRVGFIVVIAWLIALLCFQEQFFSTWQPGSEFFYWVVAGVLASIVSLLWAVMVKQESPDSPRSLLGRIACGIELIVFNLALCVFLLEVSLRIYSVVTNDPMTLSANSQDVTVVSERRAEKKRHVRFGFPFNSEGFHDTEFIRPKPDDVYRILVLGDSFGVGAVPYSHNYLTLLEKELEGVEPGKRIEVCNVGMSSTAPAHYLALLNQIGDSLAPDLVMVAFFVGNDFQSNGVEKSFASRWDSLMIFRIPARFFRMSQAKAEYVTWEPFDKETELVVPKFVDDWRLEKPTMPREMFLQIQSNRAFTFSTVRGEQWYEFACKYVREIARDARALTGNPLVMFIIPDANQVDPALRAEVDSFIVEKTKNAQDWRPEKWDLEKPNRILNSAFDPEQIIVIDPLPAMRQAHVELESTYHLNNTHWNANGNRAGAAELGRMLRHQWERFSK